ncbi:hypothetical protein [Halomonas sp. KO116]|uniref:hypothetical protein n=1 Tax=Halomonas sp. KO116 TaxID=1504981 RepID=UPI0004E33712|nr:hypothetical protein [Halomonas sp. KO116]AJY53279.1 hypothetical protein KO116_P200172 [Halomonas sp. KO116]
MGNTSINDIAGMKLTLNKIVRNTTYVIITMGLLFMAVMPFMAGYYDSALLFAMAILSALVVLLLLQRQRKQLVKKLESFLREQPVESDRQGAA